MTSLKSCCKISFVIGLVVLRDVHGVTLSAGSTDTEPGTSDSNVTGEIGEIVRVEIDHDYEFEHFQTLTVPSGAQHPFTAEHKDFVIWKVEIIWKVGVLQPLSLRHLQKEMKKLKAAGIATGKQLNVYLRRSPTCTCDQPLIPNKTMNVRGYKCGKCDKRFKVPLSFGHRIVSRSHGTIFQQHALQSYDNELFGNKELIVEFPWKSLNLVALAPDNIDDLADVHIEAPGSDPAKFDALWNIDNMEKVRHQANVKNGKGLTLHLPEDLMKVLRRHMDIYREAFYIDPDADDKQLDCDWSKGKMNETPVDILHGELYTALNEKFWDEEAPGVKNVWTVWDLLVWFWMTQSNGIAIDRGDVLVDLNSISASQLEGVETAAAIEKAIEESAAPIAAAAIKNASIAASSAEGTSFPELAMTRVMSQQLPGAVSHTGGDCHAGLDWVKHVSGDLGNALIHIDSIGTGLGVDWIFSQVESAILWPTTRQKENAKREMMKTLKEITDEVSITLAGEGFAAQFQREMDKDIEKQKQALQSLVKTHERSALFLKTAGTFGKSMTLSAAAKAITTSFGHAFTVLVPKLIVATEVGAKTGAVAGPGGSVIGALAAAAVTLVMGLIFMGLMKFDWFQRVVAVVSFASKLFKHYLFRASAFVKPRCLRSATEHHKEQNRFLEEVEKQMAWDWIQPLPEKYWKHTNWLQTRTCQHPGCNQQTITAPHSCRRCAKTVCAKHFIENPGDVFTENVEGEKQSLCLGCKTYHDAIQIHRNLASKMSKEESAAKAKEAELADKANKAQLFEKFAKFVNKSGRHSNVLSTTREV